MKARHLRLWQLPILALILLSLACSLSVPGMPSFFATPTPTPQPLPPTVVETVPQIGSELPLQSQLLIYFSEPMDRSSTEAALTSDFPGGFLFNWVDDSTLALTPKTQLPADGQLHFTLAAGVKASNGLMMLEPLAFSYRTGGPLRVAQVLPAAQAKDVSPDSAVVVAFNQPVVTLGADNSGLPAGLSLEPAAQGKGEWLNTSTYIFHPDPTLAGGTDYIARVNPQLVSASGAQLDPNSQNTAWAFRTSFPALLGVNPKVTDGALPLDAELQLTFNQPMDRASVEAGFALNGPRGKVNGTLTWNDKSSVLTFKPAALLERATQYALTLSGQSRARAGASLGSDVSLAYQSMSAFDAWYTSFESGGTRPANKNVSITFTAPLAQYKTNDLDALITISPNASYSGSYVDGATVNINGLFEPGKSYTITFSPALKDKWGQALGHSYVFSFREPDAAASLQFGYYFPVIFTRPEQPSVDVQAVNVHSLNVSLGTLPVGDFFRYLSDYNFSKTYQPSDLQTWTENPGLSLNQNGTYSVDFSRSAGTLAPGLYYADASSNEIEHPFTTAKPLLVSNLNVTLKTSAVDVLAWVVDLRTQTAVANAAVTLYDEKGNQLASGTTDANGLWRSQLPASLDPNSNGLYVMLGQPGDDLFGLASNHWDLEISAGNFGLPFNPSGPSVNTYLYTERPIYRPGDTVHFRGVVRQAYNGRYSDAGLGTVQVSLMGGSAGNLAETTLQVSPYGSFQGEFTLSAAAVPDWYYLSVSTGDKNNQSSVPFQVADYRKPEINLSATLSPSPALNGQALTGKVDAEYFFGAPVNDLPFEWRLYSRSSYFSIPEFQTGVYQVSWVPGGVFGDTVAQGQGRTGADGTFSIPLNDIKVDTTTDLTLEITASESGGYPVSARTTVSMHPAGFYAGIRPDAWFGQAGSELGFDLLTVDLDQKPVAGKTLTASFQKVDWQRSDLAYGYDFTPIYTPVDSKPVTTDADGKAHVAFTPSEAGTFMLEVSGEGAKSQVLVWVGGRQNAAWPNLPYQHIQLTADKDKYKPGDKAGIFVPNPFGTPVQALVTTERSTILSSQVITVPAEGYTLQLPLTDEQAPNVYVSTTLLGPDNDFRQGYVDLQVEPSAFVLNVTLKATPEKAKPGDQLTLDLQVTDSKGQPVQAEFSIGVVDLAVLALADPNSQDIVPAYYSVQPLGVQTGLSAAVYAHRFFATAGGMGGGGGGENITLREKFPDTAYWKADIVTDAQGKAQVTLTLPDNLTTWQIDSRGLTGDTRVGQARVQVKTSKDLLIRPQTPRFLVVGDVAELAAIVNNTTASDLDASVSLQASGFSLNDPASAEQKVHVPANGRARVAWIGLVQAGDSVDAVFTAKAGNLQDASRPNDGPIPVLRYSAPQTFSTAGILTDAATRQEILAVPRTFQPLGGRLDLELSPSLASVVLAALASRQRSLDELSWNNELLASDFLPEVVTNQTLKDAGLSSPNLSSSIPDEVRRLLANQSSIDNGWDWVAPASGASDPYLTAYILFALNKAGSAYPSIEMTDALQRAHTYLMTAPPFDGKSDFNTTWVLNRAAFIEYALQQTGGANLTYLDSIYAGRDKLDPWAKALLAETLLSISPTDPRGTDLLSGLQNTAIRSASGVHWESAASDGQNPASPFFTSALVVYSLAGRSATGDTANPLLADAVRYLASQRGRQNQWGSPYETTWVVLALDRYMKTTGELRGNFSFSAALNGAPFAKGEASGPDNLTPVTASAPLTQLNLSGANSLLVSRVAGPGNLYYRAALTIDRPVESAPAIEQGMAVSRKFLSCNGKVCQPISSYQMLPDASGRVTVQLTVTLPHDAYYLMVQDAIPAGADILDSSLKTSQQGQPDQSVEAQSTPGGPDYDNADPFRDGWGWWYFNTPQIYNDHILWSADYLPAGTYVLTYTIVPSLPGQYRVLPAHAWQAYFPEVQGTSAGAVFEIKASGK